MENMSEPMREIWLSQCWGEGDKAESKSGAMSESMTGGGYG